MNIIDSERKWRVTPFQVENLKTGEIRRLRNNPNSNSIASITESSFQRKCEIAFINGEWPENIKIQENSEIQRLRRKENQAWEMAGLARMDGDKKDEEKWTKEARKFIGEQKALIY